MDEVIDIELTQIDGLVHGPIPYSVGI
jgi:hypothetical protein